MTEPSDETQHLLPIDIAVETPWAFEMAGVAKSPTPPAYEELLDRIAPADDPDEWFSPVEQNTAAWLRGRGLAVRSVERREGQLQKTPDAVVTAHPVTVELKSASGSVNSIVQRIRDGRWQSRRVVVDVRGTGTTRARAEAGLHRALIRYQQDLDEVVVVVSDDLSVGWTHG